MSIMKGKPGSQFSKVEHKPRFNPNTGNAVGSTIDSSTHIPSGHSITGITYRSGPDGSHADTLLHVAPEVTKQTLVERAYRK